jgi:sarcosine oxidase
MVTKVDTVVIGAGAMGSAATWQLARRGREVILLERFAPGHANGASHGGTRNFNIAYAEPTYVDLVLEAGVLWRELESETATTLLDFVGLVNHGVNPAFDDIHRALTRRGARAGFLSAQEAGEMWPGMRFTTRVLHAPDAGRVRANVALQALQTSARRRGADIRHRTPVIRIHVVDDNLVRILTHDETIEARQIVVTVGAWTEKLLKPVTGLPRLVVTQEQPAHFRPLDASTSWPSFNHYPQPDDPADKYWYSPVYGMLTPGEGVKAGWHGVGPVTDPDARSFLAEPVQMAALQRYAREWLPGVDADDFEPISCTYTSTIKQDFVLDRTGPVVIGAGFSGHGFKFTPAIGRILADLVDGRPAPDLFKMARKVAHLPSEAPQV